MLAALFCVLCVIMAIAFIVLDKRAELEYDDDEESPENFRIICF